MSSIIFGIGFTLIGAFGAFAFIYWGLVPVDKSQTGKVVGYIAGLAVCLLFVAAGIWNFTKV